MAERRRSMLAELGGQCSRLSCSAPRCSSWQGSGRTACSPGL